jgi:PPOX class probable F420-dependent enzyme
MRLDREAALGLATAADHAILGTIGRDGTPHLVPACYAIDARIVAIPIDQLKPKAATPLERERNLERDPRATLLVERWDADDWARLWWVRLGLEASIEDPETRARLEALLRRRYRQYAAARFTTILTFRIRSVSGWAASPPTT